MLETITPENINEQLQSLPQAGKQPLLRCLKKLAEHRDNAAYCERLLANFEVDAEKSWDARTLSSNSAQCWD